MPRYLIERTFALENSISLPGPDQPVQARLDFIENNRLNDVTWLHSYVTPDSRRCFCLYDAPTPEAVRRAAEDNGLVIDRINEVQVLDPYFYPSQKGISASRSV
jgi:hypothetical protein